MLLVLLIFPILLFPQKMSKEGQDFKDLVLEYAKIYLTPIQKDILKNHYCGPESYSSSIGGKHVPWNKIVSDIEVLDEISIVVHESTHRFCGSDSWDTMNFVVSDTRFIFVPKTKIFKSNLIVNDMLNRNPRTKDMFRFDNYVNTNRSMCSSTSGIYGLMNEYCAYYNETSTALILYEIFKDKYSDNVEEEEFYRFMEKEFAMAMMGSVTAFYEFNSFIGAYLIYAKENFNLVNKEILNNSLLIESYSVVTYNFSHIANKIHEYFPEHEFKIESVWELSRSSTTYGNNETLLLSQEIFNDYVDVLNDFINYNDLVLTKKIKI